MCALLRMWCFVLAAALNAPLTPKEMQARMGLGINLGNTLELAKPNIPDARMPKESYFDAYKAAGFTNVRIPVRWAFHAGETAPCASKLQRRFNILDIKTN